MIYELHTSTGQKIRIDDDDLKKISDNTDQFMVKLKQGIVRPPFISVIVPTNEKETKIESIIERRGDRLVVTGEKEVKVLKDLMTLPIQHDQLPDGKNNRVIKKLP
jgi:hypothetical protein